MLVAGDKFGSTGGWYWQNIRWPERRLRTLMPTLAAPTRSGSLQWPTLGRSSRPEGSSLARHADCRQGTVSCPQEDVLEPDPAVYLRIPPERSSATGRGVVQSVVAGVYGGSVSFQGEPARRGDVARFCEVENPRPLCQGRLRRGAWPDDGLAAVTLRPASLRHPERLSAGRLAPACPDRHHHRTASWVFVSCGLAAVPFARLGKGVRFAAARPCSRLRNVTAAVAVGWFGPPKRAVGRSGAETGPGRRRGNRRRVVHPAFAHQVQCRAADLDHQHAQRDDRDIPENHRTPRNQSIGRPLFSTPR